MSGINIAMHAFMRLSPRCHCLSPTSPVLCVTRVPSSPPQHTLHTPPDPRADGLGVSTCIELALKDAGIDREQVNYINAHATR